MKEKSHCCLAQNKSRVLIEAKMQTLLHEKEDYNISYLFVRIKTTPIIYC